jgi:hypothetical protein
VDVLHVPLIQRRVAHTVAIASDCQSVQSGQQTRVSVSYFGDATMDPNQIFSHNFLAVLRVLQTQYRSSAALAAIFIIYAISALRFGFLLRKHISLYQIDYV